MKRRKNPVHTSGKKFRFRWDDGIRKPLKGEQLTKRQRREFSRTVKYLDRVKAMRPFFGEMFKPGSGYDLREIDSWTPQQKKKVTDYWRVMAPRVLSTDKVVKRYKKPKHLKAAIDATLQEKPLKGQTAAVFSVDPGQPLEVRFSRKGKITVKRGGVATDKMLFDKRALLLDPESEIDRVLSQTDATLFKIITGANLTNDTYTRSRIRDALMKLMESYPVDAVDRIRQRGGKKYLEKGRRWDDWLNGLQFYTGVTAKEMYKRDAIHKKESKERYRDKNKKYKKSKQAVDRSAKLTGRRGRVK